MKKIHFWSREIQAEGRLVRCGLRIADYKFTTTARAAVTCDRCARFLHLDHDPSESVTKSSRRKRPRIL